MHFCWGWRVHWTQRFLFCFQWERYLCSVNTRDNVSQGTGLHGSLLILVTPEFITWIWSNHLGDVVLLIILKSSFPCGLKHFKVEFEYSTLKDMEKIFHSHIQKRNAFWMFLLYSVVQLLWSNGSPPQNIQKKPDSVMYFDANCVIILFCLKKQTNNKKKITGKPTTTTTTKKKQPQKTHSLFFHCSPTLFFLVKSSLI